MQDQRPQVFFSPPRGSVPYGIKFMGLFFLTLLNHLLINLNNYSLTITPYGNFTITSWNF